MPRSFAEAKTFMALFQKWGEIQGVPIETIYQPQAAPVEEAKAATEDDEFDFESEQNDYEIEMNTE